MNAARHGAGFAISGAIAFSVDAAVLAFLTRVAGIDPFSARLAAIAAAMTAGYFAHRRLTFAMTERPSLAEFGKFVAVASSAAALNYAIYSALLLLRPTLDPLAALVVASLAAMAASYVGYRFGVFRAKQ